jgi:pimeloyl-ACP methyl ester carboxylesterase
LFDYFEVDETNKTLTMRPHSVQVKMLNEVVTTARKNNPDAIIDLIGHSQGTVVVAMARPEGIRKAILLAPVFDMSLERTFRRYKTRPNAEINLDGVSKIGVLDGYMRYVPKECWEERVKIDPFKEYNALAEKAEVTVITAGQDEVLGDVDLDNLSPKIKQMPLDGNHNFTDEVRGPLKGKVKELILG